MGILEMIYQRDCDKAYKHGIKKYNLSPKEARKIAKQYAVNQRREDDKEIGHYMYLFGYSEEETADFIDFSLDDVIELFKKFDKKDKSKRGSMK